MKAFFTKTQYGLAPEDPNTKEWLDKLKLGQTVRGEFRKVRNYAFHKKYFALLNIAYDYWEPQEIDSKYGKPEKNFDRFRADLIILAGFYDVSVRLDGKTRIEPKSISFAKMDEEEFQTLFSATVDVLLKYVYDKSWNEEKLKEVVDQYMSFV